MEKFKKGDKVIVTKKGGNRDFNKLGAILIVNENDNRVPYCLKESGKEIIICEKRIELYQESKTLKITVDVKKLKELKRCIKRLNKAIKGFEEF
jgi:hypothetical protein